MAINANLHPLTIFVAAVSSAALAQGQNQIVSAGLPLYSTGLQSVAPGEVLTLFTTALNVPDAVATQTPLPTSLSGVSVRARVIGATNTAGYPALLPILNIHTNNVNEMPDGVPCPTTPNINCSNTLITVEIPTEGVCTESLVLSAPENCAVPPPFSVYNLPPLLILNVSANGVTGPDMPLQVVAWHSHPLNSCDYIFEFGPSPSSCYAEVTHADGSLVSATGSSPAHVGETISVYAVGLGVGNGAAPPTGSAPSAPMAIFGSPVGTASTAAMVFSYNYPLPTVPAPSGRVLTVYATSRIIVNPDWAGLIPGYVGLYQVNVTVPPAPGQSYPACGPGGNTVLTFLGTTEGSLSICVEP